MQFEFIPFYAFLPIKFGDAPSTVTSIIGTDYIKNDACDKDYAYVFENVTIVFSCEDKVVEASIGEKYIFFYKGINLFTLQNPVSHIKKETGLQEYSIDGFISFPHLGLAFSGFQEDSEYGKNISVFTRERMKEFVDDDTIAI